MTSPFSQPSRGGAPNPPSIDWGGIVVPTISNFVPFPNLGQPGSEEIGYGMGGYGEGGYDSPPVPSSSAPQTAWTIEMIK